MADKKLRCCILYATVENGKVRVRKQFGKYPDLISALDDAEPRPGETVLNSIYVPRT